MLVGCRAGATHKAIVGCIDSDMQQRHNLLGLMMSLCVCDLGDVWHGLHNSPWDRGSYFQDSGIFMIMVAS